MEDVRIQGEIAALEARYAGEDSKSIDESVAEVMATAAGRRVMAWICRKGRVFGQVGRDAASDDNPLLLAYRSGRREAAVDIYAKANAVAPEMVVKMMAERNEVEWRRRNRIDELRKGLENQEENQE